jgi:predicted GH43/DUF377 family glycosyl hydrolase
MVKPFINTFALIILVIIVSACEPAAPSITASTTPVAPVNTPSMTPIIAIPSPASTQQVATSTSEASSIKFSYKRPPAKLTIPSVLFKDTGAVVYHDGKFHLFYNCQYNWPPTEVNIAYAVSEDGITWQQVKNDTIISEKDIPYPVHSILASTVFVMDDGTWVLYFSTWGNGTQFIPPSLIGRAIAPSPEGPWTVDPEPVLEPSQNGWDSGSVQRPDVLRVGDIYYLYYFGSSSAGGMIGMATSSDGIHWTRYDDPATTDPLYAESDPVFTPEQNGSSSLELRYPRVLNTPDGWLLFYWTSTPNWPQANPFTPTNGLINLATSSDGIHWTKAQEEPIFTPEEISSGVTAIYTPVVVLVEDVYYMFIEMEYISGAGLNTNIVLTTHDGLLFP